MLAQKLVANVTYDTGREVETLELFKVDPLSLAAPTHPITYSLQSSPPA